MLQIRHGLFETNSSSASTFVVHVFQVDGIEVPKRVDITSDGCPWETSINGVYELARRNNQDKDFLGLLASWGVKEIYVDNQLVKPDFEDNRVTFLPDDEIKAMCFGDYKKFYEVQGWGDEYEDTHYLSIKEIYEIQTKAKDPSYAIRCMDEDGNDVEWSSTEYSKRVITQADLDRYHEPVYEEESVEEPDYEEWLEDSKKFEKYEGDEDYDRLTNKVKEQGSKDQRYIRRNGYRDKKYKHL